MHVALEAWGDYGVWATCRKRGLVVHCAWVCRYFYVTIALLGASLAACTYTRQWPAVKVAQRWRFQGSGQAVVRQAGDKGRAEVLPHARLRDLGLLLREKGYQVCVIPESGDGDSWLYQRAAGADGKRRHTLNGCLPAWIFQG